MIFSRGLRNSSGGAFQPVGNALPFRGFRWRFDHNPFRARLVAPVQLGVNRPRECLGVVRDYTYAGKFFTGWNPGMRNDVAGRRLQVESRESKSASFRQFKTTSLAFGA